VLDYCKRGRPIVLDDLTKEIVYSNVSVLVSKINDAVNSGFDKVELAHNLFCVKRDEFMEFGCLTLSKTQYKQLKIKVWKILKEQK
jgi:hypothetical protein